jgi:hypothetical protein
MARREALIHRTLSNPVVAQLDGKLRVAAEIKSLSPAASRRAVSSRSKPSHLVLSSGPSQTATELPRGAAVRAERSA